MAPCSSTPPATSRAPAYRHQLLQGLCLTATLLVSSLHADYPIAAHRYLADPAVLVHDGRVYVYASNDDDNAIEGGYTMHSLVCISSSDLKNWTDHGVVFQVPRDAAWANNSWAPAVIERDGHILLYFGNGGGGIGVVRASSPTGPFDDPVGRTLVSYGTPGASGTNMWLFDPAAFIDDDGQAYLYFGGNGENNVRVIRLNRDMISIDGAAQAMSAPAFFEAAWMHKRNGLYYFSYSTNPSNGMRIDYLTSSTGPTSGFSYTGIVAPQPPRNNNNNHAAIFELGGDWYFLYHNRDVATAAGIPTTYKRNLGIEPLMHNEDGTIRTITFTRDGLSQRQSLNPFSRVEAETFAEQKGVETEPGPAGMVATQIRNGDWLRVRSVDFATGAASFRARVASASTGEIQLRLDRVDGPLIGTCTVSATGGLQNYQTVYATVDHDLAQGIHDLYFVFVHGTDADFLGFDWWQFGAGEMLSWAAWQAAAFPGVIDIQMIGPDADPDGDGLRNLLEYGMGTSPTTPDAIAVRLERPNWLHLALPWSSQAVDVTRKIQSSTDLVHWVDVAENSPENGESTSATVTEVAVPGDGGTYLRIVAHPK